MGFDDLNAAFKMRDVITKIAETVVESLRPEARTATVTAINRQVRECTIQFVGETDTWTARYPKSSGPSIGDTVKVYIRNNRYWVAEVFDAPAFGAITTQERQIEPRLTGGFYGDTDLGVYFGFDAYNTAVAVGSCLYLGSFKNTSSFYAGRARIEFNWNDGFLANQFTHWTFFWAGDDPDGTWKVVIPDQVSGILNGHGVQLEARATGGQIEFRIRRKLDSGATFGGLGVGGARFDGNLIDRDTSVQWNYSYTDTEPTDTFGAIPGGNAENAISSVFYKGPFYDAEKFMIQSRAENQLTGGGIIKWDGQYLSWTQPFRVHLGNNPFSAQGFLAISYPAVGTVITHHGHATTSQTTTASGIDMKAGAETNVSLYYEPVLRSSGNSVDGRFHIVGSATNVFSVPSHWIFLSATNSLGATNIGVASLYLGVGRELDHWRALSPYYQNGWGAFGGAYNSPSFKKEQGITYLRGMFAGGTASAVMANIPAGYRPGADNIFVGSANLSTTGGASAGTSHTHPHLSYGGQRITIRGGGDIEHVNPVSGSLTNNYQSISGIFFHAEA